MRFGRTLPPAAAQMGITEFLSGILGILRGQRELARFELELKKHFGVKYCFLVSSGKAAFALILAALKEMHPDRGDVVIPAFTCFSVPSSIVRAGLGIRLCDMNPDRLDFDFSALSAILAEASYGPMVGSPQETVDGSLARRPCSDTNRGASRMRILAVVPTHLFGIPADVTRLRETIRDPAIAIIEDAAQAMGETWEGRKAGTLGDISFFSLGRGKALSVVEGGIILTDRDDLAGKLHPLVSGLPSYGLLPLLGLIFKAASLIMFIRPRLFWVPKAIPFLKLGETLFEPHFPMRRMSSFQAGLARNWRKTLENLRDVRTRNVKRWIALLEGSRTYKSNILTTRLLGLLRFPLRVHDDKSRASILREAAHRGLGVMPTYPTSIDEIPALKGRITPGDFPVAKGCAREIVTLPTHGFLTEEDVMELRGLLLRPER